MKRTICLILAVLLLGVIGCSCNQVEEPAPTLEPTDAPVPTATAAPSVTAAPTTAPAATEEPDGPEEGELPEDELPEPIAQEAPENCTHETVEYRVVKSPTCSEEGEGAYVCVACGETVRTETIAVTDHVYLDGKCIWCGAQRPEGGSDSSLELPEDELG